MTTSIEHIHLVYDHVCAEYGVVVDASGFDAISKLKRERTKAGRPKKFMYEITEAEIKFLQYDCVFISAERSPENGGTPESNETNTKRLRDDLTLLKNQGLLVFYDSEGEYLEEGSTEIQHEHGFFCTDVGPQVATEFFSELYKLSALYEQDSFLFKSAGGTLTRTGFFIATNDAARNAHKNEHNGEFWRAGELYLDLPPEDYWSTSKEAFGSQRVFFKCEKPSFEK